MRNLHKLDGSHYPPRGTKETATKSGGGVSVSYIFIGIYEHEQLAYVVRF